jgi:hypothetical protein
MARTAGPCRCQAQALRRLEEIAGRLTFCAGDQPGQLTGVWLPVPGRHIDVHNACANTILLVGVGSVVSLIAIRSVSPSVRVEHVARTREWRSAATGATPDQRAALSSRRQPMTSGGWRTPLNRTSPQEDRRKSPGLMTAWHCGSQGFESPQLRSVVHGRSRLCPTPEQQAHGRNGQVIPSQRGSWSTSGAGGCSWRRDLTPLSSGASSSKPGAGADSGMRWAR